MVWQSLIAPATKLLDKVIVDKDQKAKLAHEIATMAEKHHHELQKGQLDANKEQAKHSSVFVAGARPAILWVCCLGLLTQFFIMPIAEWIATIWFPDVTLPKLKTDQLMTLTLSLLGLGGLRSYEKTKGVERNAINKKL